MSILVCEAKQRMGALITDNLNLCSAARTVCICTQNRQSYSKIWVYFERDGVSALRSEYGKNCFTATQSYKFSRTL